MAEKKYVDYSGLELFWGRICKRFDKKLESVSGKDDSIEVSNNNQIAVKISPSEDNYLTVKSGEGLFVSKPKMSKLTFGSDKDYIYDGTEDVTVPVYNGEYDE